MGKKVKRAEKNGEKSNAEGNKRDAEGKCNAKGG